MAYDPYADTPEGKSQYFHLLWLGGILTVIALGLHVAMAVGTNALTIMGSVYGLALLFWRRHDDYMLALLNTGTRWGMALLGLWLLVLSFLVLFGGAIPGGFVYRGEEEARFLIPAVLADPITLLLSAWSSFYLGAIQDHWMKS